jgi:hypothetical protein
VSGLDSRHHDLQVRFGKSLLAPLLLDHALFVPPPILLHRSRVGVALFGHEPGVLVVMSGQPLGMVAALLPAEPAEVQPGDAHQTTHRRG